MASGVAMEAMASETDTVAVSPVVVGVVRLSRIVSSKIILPGADAAATAASEAWEFPIPDLQATEAMVEMP